MELSFHFYDNRNEIFLSSEDEEEKFESGPFYPSGGKSSSNKTFLSLSRESNPRPPS